MKNKIKFYRCLKHIIQEKVAVIVYYFSSFVFWMVYHSTIFFQAVYNLLIVFWWSSWKNERFTILNKSSAFDVWKVTQKTNYNPYLHSYIWISNISIIKDVCWNLVSILDSHCPVSHTTSVIATLHITRRANACFWQLTFDHHWWEINTCWCALWHASYNILFINVIYFCKQRLIILSSTWAANSCWLYNTFLKAQGHTRWTTKWYWSWFSSL